MWLLEDEPSWAKCGVGLLKNGLVRSLYMS